MWKKILVVGFVLVFLGIGIFAAVILVPKIWNEKQPEGKLQEIISVETEEERFESGSKLSSKDFTVIGKFSLENGKIVEQEIQDFEISPKKVPEKGRSFSVTISVGESEKSTELLNDREIVEKYKIGKYKKEDVTAILYVTGEFEIEGAGEVINYPDGKVPWMESENAELITDFSYISPEAQIESLDYWFKDCKNIERMSCQIPPSIKSMRETFAGAEKLKKISDMVSATGLQDITQMCDGCVALEEVGKLPVNLKTMQSSFRDCESLKRAADVSECKKLNNMESAYEGAIALAEVSVGENVQNFKAAYKDCVNVKEGILPAHAANISECYSGCTHMTSVSGGVSESCEEWAGAFKNCYFLGGDLSIVTRETTLNNLFSGAAISGDTLYLTIVYKGEEEQGLEKMYEDIQKEVAKGSDIKIK